MLLSIKHNSIDIERFNVLYQKLNEISCFFEKFKFIELYKFIWYCFLIMYKSIGN